MNATTIKTNETNTAANRLEKRMVYVGRREDPKNIEKIEGGDLYQVFIKHTHDAHYVYCFRGTAGNPTARQAFRTPEEATEYATKWAKFEEARATKKAEQKEQKKTQQKTGSLEAAKAVKTGDVFVCSWGYKQTNVNFYQVLAVTGQTVTVQEIGCKITETHNRNTHSVKPVKNDFIAVSAPIKKLLKGNGKTPQIELGYGVGQLTNWENSHTVTTNY